MSRPWDVGGSKKTIGRVMVASGSSASPKWEAHHYGAALMAAIESRADTLVPAASEMIRFNAWWREGDGPTVSAWPHKGTWHDHKTQEGGGVKEFARTAFKMSFTAFMDKFGGVSVLPLRRAHLEVAKPLIRPGIIDACWSTLVASRSEWFDHAAFWLEHIRGIPAPRELIYSGFETITVESTTVKPYTKATPRPVFPPGQQRFLREHLSRGEFMAAPIRSAKTGLVNNILLRRLDPEGKADKVRLLPGCGGWSDEDGTPRGYGMLHQARDASTVVLCEGLVDTLSAEALLQGQPAVSVVGSPSAKTLPRLGQWLSQNSAAGIAVLFHLDSDLQSGKISATGIGQQTAAQTVKLCRELGRTARLFPWPQFLMSLRAMGLVSAVNDVRDLGDALALAHKNGVPFEQMQSAFKRALEYE